MRYGTITSRRGTRREIGRMSVAGDQGEARKAWQEVEKQDKASVATMGGGRVAKQIHARSRVFSRDGPWVFPGMVPGSRKDDQDCILARHVLYIA